MRYFDSVIRKHCFKKDIVQMSRLVLKGGRKKTAKALNDFSY